MQIADYRLKDSPPSRTLGCSSVALSVTLSRLSVTLSRSEGSPDACVPPHSGPSSTRPVATSLYGHGMPCPRRACHARTVGQAFQPVRSSVASHRLAAMVGQGLSLPLASASLAQGETLRNQPHGRTRRSAPTAWRLRVCERLGPDTGAQGFFTALAKARLFRMTGCLPTEGRLFRMTDS